MKSMLHFFAVPTKGDSDVRIVFDGTSCGLNDALWSPNFFLPTSRNASELLSFDSLMADADFSEFFHNFFSDEMVRGYSGVDTTCLSPFLDSSARLLGRKGSLKHSEGRLGQVQSTTNPRGSDLLVGASSFRRCGYCNLGTAESKD